MCEALATMSSIVEKRKGEGEREGGKRDSCGIYIKLFNIHQENNSQVRINSTSIEMFCVTQMK